MLRLATRVPGFTLAITFAAALPFDAAAQSAEGYPSKVVKLVVPFPPGGPTDPIGGQIQVGITGLPAMQAYARAGRIRILAVTTPNRVASNPDLPSIAEQGFPGFSVAPWAGFFVPKGTPPAIVNKLAADLIKVMQMPEVKDKMANPGSELVAGKPDEFRRFVEGEIQKWADAVKVAGVKVE